MPISRIGRKLTSGPGRVQPDQAGEVPLWNTATVMPNVAPTVSRKPSAALSGTSTDRNTSISSRTDSPTTSSR